MRKYWLLAIVAVVVLIVLALAWVSGGQAPVREISTPIPVPGVPK
jgi:hypothetical protein